MLSIESLERVESLGNNCEVGFVLKNLGHTSGGVFRWVAVKPSDAYRAVMSDFDGVFEFGNLAPHSSGMVFDKRSRIAFHSKMRSHRAGAELEFIDPEEKRRELYALERQRFEVLTERFRDRLKVPGIVYVTKSNRGIEASELRGIADYLERVRSSCSFKLLHVETSSDSRLLGTVQHIGRNLFRGYVEWFSPALKADHADYPRWNAILTGCLTEAVRT
jgi:hypothetical protein